MNKARKLIFLTKFYILYATYSIFRAVKAARKSKADQKPVDR